MRKYKTITLFLLALIVFQACEYIFYVNKESEVIRIHKDFGPISKVTIGASCRLVLSMEENTELTLIGQKHLLEGFEIEYSEGAIKISHKTNTLQRKKLVEICISAKALQQITCTNACEITNYEPLEINTLTMTMNGSSEFTESDLDIHCQKLRINCYGNSNIGQHTLKGNVNELFMNLEGRIKVEALDLIVQKANVTNKSGYDCYLNIHELLTVKTYSSGNTFYKGDPELVHERYHVPYLNSTGEVIPYD